MKVQILDGKKSKFALLQTEVVYGYEIPQGFITDFASVPRSLWNVLPPLGKHNRAALLHDYLYDHRIGTRKQADLLFLKIMLNDGVNPIQAHIMYWGVRIGGLKWWKS